MKRAFFTASILLAFFLSLGFFHPAYALKKRVRAARPKISYSSVRLARDSHSVVVTFANLSQVRRIDYVLSYEANGIPQGVVGAFTPSGQATDSRDLYFGTCSKGVCTPHYGITNASLTVTATLTSNASYVKRYVIKNI